MTKEEIKNITDTCFLSHKDEIVKQNELHLKKVKLAISLRVTLPVTVLLALGIFLLKTMFTIGTEAAMHQAKTNQKVDVMGRTIMEETKARRESVTKLETKQEKLENKLDENLTYLYRNSMFKTRGSDLPFVSMNKKPK